ncbi:hypothetical protein DXG01_005644 [Tephrocybe rancida]|nr:hypothetical protein DXG01_005644 [Tephrocybe rancida]
MPIYPLSLNAVLNWITSHSTFSEPTSPTPSIVSSKSSLLLTELVSDFAMDLGHVVSIKKTTTKTVTTSHANSVTKTSSMQVVTEHTFAQEASELSSLTATGLILTNRSDVDATEPASRGFAPPSTPRRAAVTTAPPSPSPMPGSLSKVPKHKMPKPAGPSTTPAPAGTPPPAQGPACVPPTPGELARPAGFYDGYCTVTHGLEVGVFMQWFKVDRISKSVNGVWKRSNTWEQALSVYTQAWNEGAVDYV